MNKSSAIVELLLHLQLAIGTARFDVIDFSPLDPDLIGISAPGREEPAVCVCTRDKQPGRFDLEHGGKVYPDCLVQGVEWAVREVIKQSRV